MGVTIHYRGWLAELGRVEDFEDRLLDLALELGGQAQIWRNAADADPRRLVRGVLLNLAPGQEPVSLVVSPEGWLVGLTDVEDAEAGRLTEPPWCFCKTQFGPLEGHVAVVEVLAALGREFLADLEVSDEGGYWETRDLAELACRRGQVQGALDGLAEGLRRHGLSPEAAEDPDILVRHVERVAEQVQRILRRPAEHPPVAFPENVPGVEPDPDTDEALGDELFKHNRRQQERLQRALEERRSRGEEDAEAFENALDDLGLEPPEEESDAADEPWPADEPDLPVPAESAADSDPFGTEDDERHPLLKEAMDLLTHLDTVFRGADPKLAPSLSTLYQGAGDAMGGLAQALRGRDEEDDPDAYGLCVTQLKRALRGAAFARGALYPLRDAVTEEQFDELHRRLKRLEHDVFQELGRLRSERREDEA
jgi:hypothetical protein